MKQDVNTLHGYKTEQEWQSQPICQLVSLGTLGETKGKEDNTS